MKTVERVYDSILAEHIARHRQMAMVTGARQVGKTTTCHILADVYSNWDDIESRELLLAGPARFVDHWGLNRLSEKPSVVLFDELHKYPRWKQYLKGFYDVYSDRLKILVTGSSRLDAYRRGGDSLMGRYFVFRMHPFSIAECVHRGLPDFNRIVRDPKKMKTADIDALWSHGGYPEPFIKRDPRFSRRWQSLRAEQLLREDIRDLTQIQQVDQLGLLVKLLDVRSGGQIVYSNLAKDIRVSVDTVRRWIDALSSLHYGFLLKPWHRNVSRSLRKEPKWFLRDWSGIEDEGSKAETFVGCGLLKATDAWNDLGLGKFQLCYLRDKSQREVDFAVIRDGMPWFLVEVKYRQESSLESLRHFQEQTSAPFAFQVIADADYVDADCFESPRGPMIVPARTLLSQLV